MRARMEAVAAGEDVTRKRARLVAPPLELQRTVTQPRHAYEAAAAAAPDFKTQQPQQQQQYMSSGSSSSSSTDGAAAKLCGCGLPCRKNKCGPASKPENVGRLFYACPKPRDAGCKFFEWTDPELSGAAAAAYVRPPLQHDFVVPRERQGIIEALRLALTPERVAAIERLEQRSAAWQAEREPLLTASSFGSAAGDNPYQSPAALVADKLWGTFKGNKATAHGTFHESLACSVYEVARKAEWAERYRVAGGGGGLPAELPFEVKHPGLRISLSRPWLGASPDGLVHTLDPQTLRPVVGLLEIKAPATGVVYEDQDKYKNDKPWSGVPRQYWDQIQGIMFLLDLPWADFFVWTPTKYTLRRYPRDDAYCAELMAKLDSWYFDSFAPALLLKRAGRLAEGEVREPLTV